MISDKDLQIESQMGRTLTFKPEPERQAFSLEQTPIMKALNPSGPYTALTPTAKALLTPSSSFVLRTIRKGSEVGVVDVPAICTGSEAACSFHVLFHYPHITPIYTLCNPYRTPISLYSYYITKPQGFDLWLPSGLALSICLTMEVRDPKCSYPETHPHNLCLAAMVCVRQLLSQGASSFVLSGYMVSCQVETALGQEFQPQSPPTSR